jgi:hypothetical protein
MLSGKPDSTTFLNNSNKLSIAKTTEVNAPTPNKNGGSNWSAK